MGERTNTALAKCKHMQKNIISQCLGSERESEKRNMTRLQNINSNGGGLSSYESFCYSHFFIYFCRTFLFSILFSASRRSLVLLFFFILHISLFYNSHLYSSPQRRYCAAVLTPYFLFFYPILNAFQWYDYCNVVQPKRII